jgi:hypothetical protein
MLLLGLGLRRLSVAPSSIPEIKEICRMVTIPQCQAIAVQTLTMQRPREIDAYLTAELKSVSVSDRGVSQPMLRQRVRVRFRKQGDLRWISHRDLVRVFERMMRRAGLRLGMSEGFIPKARMTFPSALALGVEGLDEVMEFELAEPLGAEELAQRLADQAPGA